MKLPKDVHDVWTDPGDRPKFCRVDITGIKHRIKGYNEDDGRIVLHECNTISAWPYHNPNIANKTYTNCEVCFDV